MANDSHKPVLASNIANPIKNKPHQSFEPHATTNHGITNLQQPYPAQQYLTLDRLTPLNLIASIRDTDLAASLRYDGVVVRDLRCLVCEGYVSERAEAAFQTTTQVEKPSKRLVMQVWTPYCLVGMIQRVWNTLQQFLLVAESFGKT